VLRPASAGQRPAHWALALPTVALLLVLIVLSSSACSPGAPAPTATPAAKPPQATAAVPPPAAATAGQLADAGRTVFSASCARCHGANGQGGSGPANIGSSNQLAKYANGEGLYDKVSATMPVGAPGSLTAGQYLQLTAFLLLQNGFVKAADPLDAAKLSAIPLK
jgi:polar amino acid transport system substrate-binding protein